MAEIIRRFFKLTGDRRWMFTEAVLFVFSSKVLLSLLPLRTVMKISLTHKSIKEYPVSDTLKEIQWALLRSDRVAFWKNRCLVKSIAGRWMLQRRGLEARLAFGVIHDRDKKLRAHAWLNSGDFEVVEKGGDYLELSAF